MSPDERIRELNEFLFFATQKWPALRTSVRGLSLRCEKCILSEICSPLEGGLCLFCRTADVSPPPAQATSTSSAEELDHILRESAGVGSEYDAVVLFSGGKDSAYLVYRLMATYPSLRLQALMIDNGFTSSVALNNAHRLAAQLALDLVLLKPRPALFEKSFRHALTHLGTGGCYATVDRMDGDLIFDIGRNFAARAGIPLLIAGLSPEQVERILELKHFESPREREGRPRLESAGFPLADLYSPSERSLFWWDGGQSTEGQHPRVLFPFHAWNCTEPFVRSEVLRLGLIMPGHDNPLITNSDLVPVMLAADAATLGYSSFEPEFATMIRQGQAERQTWLFIFEALEFLVREGRFLPGCLGDTLSRLGLTHRALKIPLPADASLLKAA